MRLHGTLTKWNDDRGFGFVTPSKGATEIFVHISAFPRAGGRPQLNELISFETEPGPDGRLRAVRVMRPARPRTVGRSSAIRDRERRPGRRLGGALTLLATFAIGVYGYAQFTNRGAPGNDTHFGAPTQSAPPSPQFSCDGRTMCSQMSSCAEATYFIKHCPGTKMDGDGDGIPCESQFCG